jgi:hypothetical protein
MGKAEDLNKRYELKRKFREYEMKIIKMAGYLADYYIDRAIESDDYSKISSLLISYFSGPAGQQFDIGYLVTKYKEYGLNEKIEDIDFNIDEWYKIKSEIEDPLERYLDRKKIIDMTEDEYIQYMIEQRKKESEEE